MKIGNVPSSVLFFGSAILSALVLYPTVSDAAAVWRRQPATQCVLSGAALPDLRLRMNSGMAMNQIVTNSSGSAWPDVSRFNLECPIVEDEAGHVKGGATVKFTLAESTLNWGSTFMACSVFDFSGGTCTQLTFASATDGVHEYSISPASSVWATATGFAYVVVGLGSRSKSTTTPNALHGYVLTKG